MTRGHSPRLLSPADRSGWMEMRRAIVCLLYIAVLCKSGSSEPHNELDAVRHEMATLRAQLREVQQQLQSCRGGDQDSDDPKAPSQVQAPLLPPPPPRHHHPPHRPPQPASPPPSEPSKPPHIISTAALEKKGTPCPVEWGSRRDGTRLRSIGDTTLSGCCSLCRAAPNCNALNFDANQGSGRCYLLAASTAARQVKDVSQRAVYSSAPRTDGCSCAKIGSFATGRDSLAFAKELN